MVAWFSVHSLSPEGIGSEIPTSKTGQSEKLMMEKHRFYLVTFSLMLLLSIAIHSTAEVIALTADTFSDKFSNVTGIIVVILVIWFFLLAVFRSVEGRDHRGSIRDILQPVKEKDTAWFVKFCVPWCKHCKNLGSLWEDLGKAMEGEDEIEIGEVDCGSDKPLCSKVNIHSYPTFKLFYDGEEVAKYQGKRNIEDLRSFVLEEAENAATRAQVGSDMEL